MSQVFGRPRFSRFDRLVGALALVVVAALGLLAWRGDQVGIHVVSMAPAADAEGVSTRTQLALQFDQPLASAAEQVRVELDPPAAGEVFLNGDQLRFVPAAPLAPDTAYNVRLEAGLRSRQGRILTEPITWQFRTGATQLVYSTAIDGAEQLFVVKPSLTAPLTATALSRPTALTALPAGIWDFAVAPASGRIAFAALTATEGSDIWQVAVGSAPALLQACPDGFCSTPSWSPDGKLLSFSQCNANEFGVAAISPPRLYLRDMASGETAPIFSDSQRLGFEARWSADGRWITYISPDFVGLGAYNLESGAGDFYATSSGEPGIWRPQQTLFLMTELRQVGETYVVHLKGPNIVISVWLMEVASGEQWQVAAPGQRPQWLP